MYGKFDQRDSNASNNQPRATEYKMSIYKERDQNTSFFQYILSVFGLATGYGSVWRLPFYIFRYEGGVFLIPYIILTLTVGIPVFYLETMLGQVYGKGPTQLYSIFHKKFKGFGLFSVLIICSILIYYNLIFSYNLFFLYESYNTVLPWRQPEKEKYPLNTQFFLFDFIHSTPSINETGIMIWMVFAFYVAGQVIVFFSKPKDAKQLGQLGIYSTITPFIVMLLMLVRCIFLQGASEGLHFLFVPNLDKLFHSKLWVDAGVQVLFQYTLGIGAERNRDEDIIRPSYTIPLLTSLFGILSSAVIFSFLGYAADVGEVHIMDVTKLGVGGHSLAFVLYPAIVAQMPLPNFFSIIFFGTLLFQGIDKQLYYIDCIIRCIEDEFKTNTGVIKIGFTYYSIQTVRFLICIIICFFGLLLSTQSGVHYLNFLDFYSVRINLLLSVTLQTIFFTWYKSWSQELEPKIMEYIKIPSPRIYVFLIKFWVPFILGFLVVHAILEQLDRIGDQLIDLTILGWCITGYPLVLGIIVYRSNLGETESTGFKDTEFEYLKYLNLDRQDSQQVLKKTYN